MQWYDGITTLLVGKLLPKLKTEIKCSSVNNNSCMDSMDDMERKYTVAGSGVEGHVKALICVHRLTMVTQRGYLG